MSDRETDHLSIRPHRRPFSCIGARGRRLHESRARSRFLFALDRWVYLRDLRVTLYMVMIVSHTLCLPVAAQALLPSLQGSTTSLRSPERLDAKVSAPQRLNLNTLIRDVIDQHPSARAKRFEVDAARWGFKASQETLAPQLSGTLDLSDDLATLPNPLEMGRRTPFETRRYSAEIRFVKPLQWGTRLGFGLRQGQIETTNPFRNCIPGIISERCYDSSLTLSLTQPLLRGKSAEANLAPERLATAQLKASRAALRGEVRRLVERAVNAYLQLSLSQARLQLEKRELALTQRQLSEAQERLKAGVIAASDLLPLRGALAQRQQTLITAQAQVREAYAQLNALTSDRLIGEASLPREILAPTLARPLIQLEEPPLERQHPDLLALEAGIDQLLTQRLTQRDQERPQLDLALVWSQSGLGEEFTEALKALPNNESRFYGVTLSYNQPISDQPQHLTAQLESQIRARRAERESLLRQLRLSWSNACAQLLEGERSLRWSREAAQAAIGSAEASRERLAAGRGTQFEALELQSRAFAAQTQILIAEHEVAQRVLTLLSLSGQLLPRFGVEVDVSQRSPDLPSSASVDPSSLTTEPSL